MEGRDLPILGAKNRSDGMQVEEYESRSGNLLRVRIDRLIADAKNEVFVDGMDSTFSRQLHRIIETFGHRAIRALEMAMERRLNVEVAEELLRQLGYMEDSGTHGGRLNILLQSLKFPDPRVRDAASIGLAAMDDRRALPAVRAAYRNECYALVKDSLKMVVDQLQATP